MDKSIIPIQAKERIVTLYAVLALTGALFAGVFFAWEKLGIAGIALFAAISAIIGRWSKDVERAERNYRRRKRTR